LDIVQNDLENMKYIELTKTFCSINFNEFFKALKHLTHPPTILSVLTL